MDQSPLFRKLVEVRFDNFVAMDDLGVVYALGLMVVAVTYVGSVIGALGAGSLCTTGINGSACNGGDPVGGLVVLTFGLVIALLAAMCLKIILDVVAVLFAIHYDIRVLSGQSGLQPQRPGLAAQPPPSEPPLPT